MFSESNYYQGFKRIRNKFRRYAPYGQIENALRYANGGRSKLDNIKRHPWLMMLLVKWILLDDNFDDRGRPAPADSNTNLIYQGMHDLSGRVRGPRDYDNVQLWIRAIGYQQFIYQENFSAANFVRQFILFADLDENHRFRRVFREHVGLDINVFLELSLIVLTRFFGRDHFFISRSWFGPLENNKNGYSAERFLKAISLTLPQFRARLQNEERNDRLADEYYEQTPFVSTPLLNVQGQYWVFHHNILFRGLEHFVYDQLRAINAQEFMNPFGKVFEAHIGTIIRETQLPVINEADLVKTLGKQSGRLIDFIIFDDNAHIFVDAKGVSSTHKAMVSHLSRLVLGSTANHALTAIDQALEVQTWLQQQDIDQAEFQAQNENFLIVVTYKELYLGNGITFRDAVAREGVEQIYERYESRANLPLENIYFMGIDSFELLCQAARAGEISLADALRQARVNDSNPSTRNFSFSLHLGTMETSRHLSQVILDRFEIELESLSRKLGGN
ncbi:MAG: hypothetical protein DRR42_16435 [Gammaproteobacteria bacterium]|nr:MAG: hypothetical protein DRR42_16435 [Gammaproteobacteria bacterium]